MRNTIILVALEEELPRSLLKELHVEKN